MSFSMGSNLHLTIYKIILLLLVIIIIVHCISRNKKRKTDYAAFFKSVQMQSVFHDSKTFADAIPLYSHDTIVSRYSRLKNTKDFKLEDFIVSNYKLPVNNVARYVTDTSLTVDEHITKLWNTLTRQPGPPVLGSLIQLPYPYVVPGGRFNEIYYWDSYFTMLGLQESNRADLIKYTIDNFSFLIDRYGFIPNGNRTYYTSRSQPPFFAQMLKLYAGIRGDTAIVRYLPQLKKEYLFWMAGAKKLAEQEAHLRVVKMPEGEILNRYWDNLATPRPESFIEDSLLCSSNHIENPDNLYRNIRAACESGWDFSSRWFGDTLSLASIHTTEIVPVDLNALLYNMEMTIATLYKTKGDAASNKIYMNLAEKRKKALLKYCWNEQERFFMDYDFIKKRNTPVFSLVASYPLFFGIATQQQAENVAQMIQTKFLKPYGLITTLHFSGQQWDAPNGWAPLHWITVCGLEKYGFTTLAGEIANRWINNNIHVYKKTGKLVEKYNVMEDLEGSGGEYPNQDGFGWTNGVLLKLLSKYKKQNDPFSKYRPGVEEHKKNTPEL